MLQLALAMTAFVGTHEVLAHPLRRPLVAKLGEGGFAILYSLVALATFVWVVMAWRATPPVVLWTAPDWLWALGAALMLVASILFVGSVTAPNPALPGAGKAAAQAPKGVQRITRHPMMWSFAIWALVHALLAGERATILLCAGIGFLALFGAYMQDGKKRDQLGDAWLQHERSTSFVPLGGQLAGRVAWSTANPGAVAIIGGVLLWLAASWAHPLLGAPAVGIWR